MITAGRRAVSWTLACLLLAGSTVTLAGTQTPPVPVPRPFPGAGSSPPPAPPQANPPADAPGSQSPAAPEPPAANGAAAPAATGPAAVPAVNPNAPDLGSIPVYPTADYLVSFDAGRGQTYHLYGTNQPYEDIVNYYRNVLDDGGREIYREPALRQFELGDFDEDRMAYPPSIVVKDYGSAGYLHVAGTSETRYRTIIQIVPPPPAAR